MATVLIVDEDEAAARTLAAFLERDGAHAVVSAGGAREAEVASVRHRPDVVLLDLRLRDAAGLDVLQRMRGDAAVIVVAGGADVPMAVEAMRAGAENFLVKPVEVPLLGALVERAAEKVRLRRASGRRTARTAAAAVTLAGASPAMRELQEQAERVAASEAPALVVGEVGTGKGSLARYLHARGPRRAEPLVERRVGGTGAGVAVTVPADGVTGGGTLFVHDVAELDTAQQRWLGGLADGGEGGVRVVAATGHDLVAEVTEGRFDEALYYRLASTPLHLPPLRARSRGDLSALADSLLASLRAEVSGAPPALADEARERLLAHAWPGNIRELRSVLERALLLARGADVLDVRHLPADVGAAPAGDGGGPAVRTGPARSLAEVEREHIELTLAVHGGNRTHAARELGISRATLIKKIREYDLGPRRFSGAARDAG